MVIFRNPRTKIIGKKSCSEKHFGHKKTIQIQYFLKEKALQLYKIYHFGIYLVKK